MKPVDQDTKDRKIAEDPAKAVIASEVETNERTPVAGGLQPAGPSDSPKPTPGKKLAEDAPAPVVFPDGTSNGIDSA